MERPERLPVDYRLEHNREIEAERKAWHRRKREESDEYREAYEFIDAQQKRIGDQMAKVFQSMNAVTNQMEQGTGAQPLKQEPEPALPQPLQQEPDILNGPFAIGMIPLMFLDTEAMQRALRRMALCKEIFDADQEFMSRMYPISGWEV
jgi:hypothetical protein